jgi:hypothetical protein
LKKILLKIQKIKNKFKMDKEISETYIKDYLDKHIQISILILIHINQ